MPFLQVYMNKEKKFKEILIDKLETKGLMAEDPETGRWGAAAQPGMCAYGAAAGGAVLHRVVPHPRSGRAWGQRAVCTAGRMYRCACVRFFGGRGGVSLCDLCIPCMSPRPFSLLLEPIGQAPAAPAPGSVRALPRMARVADACRCAPYGARLQPHPPAAAGEEVPSLEVWVPEKKVRAYSAKSEKVLPKKVLYKGGGAVYVRGTLSNELIALVEGTLYFQSWRQKLLWGYEFEVRYSGTGGGDAPACCAIWHRAVHGM